jgi:FkbM family methyltransferase
MQIFYGIIDKKFDITDICVSKLLKDDIITIPCDDNVRSSYFSDPLLYILKSVFVSFNDNGNDNDTLHEYNDNYEIQIDIINHTIISIKKETIEQKIVNLHSKLKLNYGSFEEEYPEQKMAVKYLNGDEKVLEIGGNIGRNSLIIASILKNQEHLLTLESNTEIVNQLIENRDLNHFNFHIENSALSKRKLIQKYWETKPSDVLLEGYQWINTISLDELRNKYKIEFDTLVLDCEGAFYYILMDMPEILDNINLIIMENDYQDISQKQYVDEILLQNNFVLDYVESGGWSSSCPCYNNFFEVWKK